MPDLLLARLHHFVSQPRRSATLALTAAAGLAFPAISVSGQNSTSAAAMKAVATVQGTRYELGNAAVRANFSVENGHLTHLAVRDLTGGRDINLGQQFTIGTASGAQMLASDLPLAGKPSIEGLAPAPNATRAAEHDAGKQICADFTASAAALGVHWCVVLRDGSRYLRQTVTLKTKDQPAPITALTLLDLQNSNAHVAGTVLGSPIVDSSAFYAFENPLAKSTVNAGHVVASLRRVLPLQAHQNITYSSVVGFSVPGQMRRTFLSYLERERIHPYRPFLTYNSWYDLAFGERYNEQGALDRVHAFGHELAEQRHAPMSSFLFDDGWDNPQSLWQFNPGFPQGMTAVSHDAGSFGAGVGMWLSPWGGYNDAKEARIAYGHSHGYEIVKEGYALSGPRYYDAFEKVCLELIDKYGVNQFKFDGTGNADQVFPGSAYDSDFDAAIHLMDRLRKEKPDLFINLTTGTYPSPFWLQYADSIWRGGEDHSFAGVGSWREKWITYRDGQTFKNIVGGGPLFPLNSLMLHSIIYAQEAEHLGGDPSTRTGVDQDFADEVWTFFGSGTDLQELYITPSLLNANNWDTLAAGARWSDANRDTLRDTHWVGGDPAALAVYGWASWRPEGAILVLRNPSDHTQTFAVDAQVVFELPARARHQYTLRDPRPGQSGAGTLALTAGQKTVVTLAPFQVRVLQESR